MAASGSLGSVAEDALEPVSVFNSFINTSAMMIGSCFLFAAFVKYNQHRINPMAAPISTVLMLLVFGLLLLLLPFTARLVGVEL